ncbi:arginase [Sulfitobacter sp. 1151]|uniref:Arginase n=2 Tax=Parasulfitobacter algicola TaxID=2614809 RepID=A0ABX2IN84_9RHOB|nr:arginase [Sulfitobacter algicola]
MRSITLLGAPVDSGKARQGCLMGPDALRVAGLERALRDLGHKVHDHGNLAPSPKTSEHAIHPNSLLKNLEDCANWVAALQDAAFEICDDTRTPIFMGGDHLMSAGTVSGVANYAQALGQEQFVLWLDAHTDFHTLSSTDSGNLHGTPVAFFTGQDGFKGYFPTPKGLVKPENICMLGIRSVDASENANITETAIDVHDMRAIDEGGIATPLRNFLSRVRAANGRLHLSFDVDFLDPSIAPAVGTTVPGGATFREAHLVMEILHDSDLVTSMDIAELNPFLDERGRTAKLIVDLIASLFGKRVMDRPTRSF